MPRVHSVPDGCAFHPRCPRAEAKCKTPPEPRIGEIPGETRAACWFPMNAEVPA